MKIHFKNQKGFSLVEVIIAVAIMSIIGVALFMSLGGASKILMKTDTAETARDLAVTQMERIKNAPYDLNSYVKDSALFNSTSGYDATIAVVSLKPDGSLQKITISVLWGGSASPSYVLTGYKMR